MSLVNIGAASAFVTRAQKQGSGILLVPTIFGINPFVRDYAQSLAADGFTSLIWDPYSGGALPTSLEAAIKMSLQVPEATAFAGMSACIDFLNNDLGIDRVGTIGFCYGGRYVLPLAALDKRLSLCVSIYPTLPSSLASSTKEDPIARAREILCPVQLVYPGRDEVTSKETFDLLQAQLYARDAFTNVLFLPRAAHSFMTRQEPENRDADRIVRPLIANFVRAGLADGIFDPANRALQQ